MSHWGNIDGLVCREQAEEKPTETNRALAELAQNRNIVKIMFHNN